MDEDAAKLVFAAIMAAGVLVWLWSLMLAVRLARPAEQRDWRMLEDDRDGEFAIETGARTVRGDPQTLSKALARSLAQINIGAFGALFEVTERTDRRIALKKTGPLMCNQPPGLYFSEAEVNFENAGHDAVKISYRLGFDRLARRVRNIALGIILGIGLPMMLIVAGVMWFIVIPSEAPSVRWQVLQTLQIVHALWPPFLILWLYSTGRRQSRTYFSNLLSTLELAE